MFCEGYPELPTFIDKVRRIIAIGDIHGDLNVAKRCFRLAKLIDDNDNWIGGDTVVVQVGDQIDSCRPNGKNDCHKTRFPTDKPEDVAVIQFFDFMHVKAQAHGGAVYSLLGNHELMNVQGDFRYVSKANMDDFNYEGVTDRRTAFEKGGVMAKHLACTRQSILVVGSNLFVHAGVLPEMLAKLNNLHIDEKSKLKYINTLVRNWLLGVLPKNLEEEWISSNDSPFWTRIYGNLKSNTTDNKLCMTSMQVLRLLQLGNMIIGHTPQSDISVSCGTIYRIDTGMSKAFPTDDKVSVLEILNDEEFRVLSA